MARRRPRESPGPTAPATPREQLAEVMQSRIALARVGRGLHELAAALDPGRDADTLAETAPLSPAFIVSSHLSRASARVEPC